MDDFFSKSTPNLIGQATTQQINDLINQTGDNNMRLPQNIWSDNFYSDFIRPNLLFFIAMFILGLFLYYKYITKNETNNASNTDKYDDPKNKENRDIEIFNNVLNDHNANVLALAQAQAQPCELNEIPPKINELYENDLAQITQDDNYTNNSIVEDDIDIMEGNALNKIWYGDNYNREYVMQNMYKTMFGEK